jgi:hypothetical protein
MPGPPPDDDEPVVLKRSVRPQAVSMAGEPAPASIWPTGRLAALRALLTVRRRRVRRARSVDSARSARSQWPSTRRPEEDHGVLIFCCFSGGAARGTRPNANGTCVPLRNARFSTLTAAIGGTLSHVGLEPEERRSHEGLRCRTALVTLATLGSTAAQQVQSTPSIHARTARRLVMVPWSSTATLPPADRWTSSHRMGRSRPSPVA